MSAKALVEIRDVLHVWIEFRAPRKGEITWCVPADATPAEALDHVICGRDVITAGEHGFGWRAHLDMPEFEACTINGETEHSRNIVVHVDYQRSEPDLSNTLSHVRLL